MDYQVEQNINLVLTGFEQKKDKTTSFLRTAKSDPIILDDIRKRLDEVYTSELNYYSEITNSLVDIAVISIDIKSLRRSLYSRNDIPPTLLARYKKRIDSLKEDFDSLREALQNVKQNYEARIRFMNSAQFIVRDMTLV